MAKLAKKLLSSIRSFLSPRESLNDLSALIQLQSLVNNYIPWSSSSMHPSAVVKLVNEVIINERINVIEFGSGVSTLLIASALRQIGSKSKIFSVEHDYEWIEIMYGIVQQENLVDHFHVIHAPLESSKYSINGLNWYSEKTLLDNLTNKCFDMAVIDGPLAFSKDIELSRYPALPFLIENDLLNSNSLVVLDDSTRPGEKKILNIWEDKYKYRFQRNCEIGIATASIGNSFTT